MKNIFTNKTILVTGGAGSIGSEIVRQLLKLNPKQVRVLDNRETAEFNLKEELKGYDNVRVLIGDIRDESRLEHALHEVDIVFHTAALKHVPLCEYNPFEAIKTNVYGTQNVISAALANNVEKVVNISTDKVTNTINTLGATKLLSERLIAAAQYFKGNKRTTFSSVRFGNVVGSQGSVIQLFRDQIKRDLRVTITDHSMTRFIMSNAQAVNHVLETAEIMQGGEIFILKMPVFKLSDLAEITIEASALKHNLRPKDIKQNIIGIRPGEKLYEDLMTQEEAQYALETNKMFIVLPPIYVPGYNIKPRKYSGAIKTNIKKYSSKEIKPLSREKLKKLMMEEDLI